MMSCPQMTLLPQMATSPIMCLTTRSDDAKWPGIKLCSPVQWPDSGVLAHGPLQRSVHRS